MKYEDMQEKFKGHINTPTEHELWNLWVAKDADYRLTRALAWLGFSISMVAPVLIIFGVLK